MTHSLPQFRKIALIYNPKSGRGQALKIANAAAEQVAELGLQSHLLDILSGPEEQLAKLEPDLIAVVGGDGSLMSLLPILIQTQTPVCMLPAGNQSLFSQYYGAVSLVDLIQNGRLEELQIPALEFASKNDGPLCQPSFFFCMASLGLDSAVVEQLHRTRTGTVNNWSYLRALLKVAKSHQAPQFDLLVDGRTVLTAQRGFLIFPNLPAYAEGLNFAPNYSPASGLRAIYYPYRGVAGFMNLALRSKFSAKFGALQGRGQEFAGQRFEVKLMQDYPVQADGEYVGSGSFSVSAGVGGMRVLKA